MKTGAPFNSISAPLIAVDPGKDKCGLAVVDLHGGVLSRQIVATAQAPSVVLSLLETHSTTQILIGDSTTSRTMRERLSTLMPAVQIIEVEEKNSTLEARSLYWRENPPRGWRRVLPLSLQEPPEPIDDFAAVILAQRFLNSLGSSQQE